MTSRIGSARRLYSSLMPSLNTLAGRRAMSRLLLAQDDGRRGNKAYRENNKHQQVGPEVGEAEGLCEGPEADLREPARWETETDPEGAARKRRKRDQQSREIHADYHGQDRCRENGGDLSGREAGDQQTKGGGRSDVDEDAGKQSGDRPLYRHAEQVYRHQQKRQETGEPDGDIWQ